MRQGTKVLIARRGADDDLSGKWEFPGGTVENGELPEECLRRELFEELRIDVQVGDVIGVTEYEYPENTIRLMFYEAEYVSGEIQPHAHDQYAWVSLPELPHYQFAPADIPFMQKLSAACGGPRLHPELKRMLKLK